ncbi:MAG: DUF4058 family protein [Okeania sp. SIO2G4]|nr:DUF4058 family protein [Okeania sp. SIO2H7]NEP71901.1 DUF4058 family protein [Okeania sp. SIO2G5]NEP93055.1 DUF4058 family protein [Okeania sp. SIO2F5]NEQ90723.1 DUF4058 family protein [Okeania sp. SIO2G4]
MSASAGNLTVNQALALQNAGGGIFIGTDHNSFAHTANQILTNFGFDELFTGTHIITSTRPFAHPQMPDVAYGVALTRSHAKFIDIWPLTLQDLLPTIPIPLRSPDSDVVLNLSAAFNEIYDEAAYDLSINYTEAPPPPILSEVEKQWVENLFGN